MTSAAPAGKAPSQWNVPNVLTGVRMLLVPVFAWMLLSHPHEFDWRLWTTVVFCIAIATDFVDGKIARKYNLVTNFGKLWDPIADKALTGMAFVGLSILGELQWWVTIIILIREWGITILRWGIMKYGVMAANQGGKLKTFTQSLALVLYLMWLPKLPEVLQWLAWGLMGAAFVLTVLTGLDYLREAARLRREALARWAAEGHPGRP
ncbi:CDP-diacylglycerol--glycerol-3-phosphate 3-phosphatidyltransferase [Luteococcus japonicus]|uniref:CDP-diacylglycerol--glycerol-3-phosphate 3-phosphatidyltransferase n=2 Tax=Luteococcus japonicus TaxID=33984 RepID=A0A1R4JSE4_9ACTN|nr:CDP-diacylglycerol--glycerol-3-phosphate 3-phosphatidyltransferase [Luteococcus japonicus]ROR55916.1 CDP-diacylglycerol--glycerol-3-phosphate 3-phosphatidyltransferase [Luteococcus japonicus]SJN34946.1 CDP-diacylglycerol--glycerol-3-phosphate 3-phosphatidyltransferase [Luteococcus japonicus LSP_Lj1]